MVFLCSEFLCVTLLAGSFADADGSLGVAFLGAFLFLAQRAFCASAMRARVSGLIVRRLAEVRTVWDRVGFWGILEEGTPRGRPGLRFPSPLLLLSSALTSCSRVICASIARMIALVSIESSDIEDSAVCLGFAVDE